MSDLQYYYFLLICLMLIQVLELLFLDSTHIMTYMETVRPTYLRKSKQGNTTNLNISFSIDVGQANQFS